MVRCGLATPATSQPITAAVIDATRAALYHAGVKPWARAPWAHARATSSCRLDELPTMSQRTGCTSEHRSQKRCWEGLCTSRTRGRATVRSAVSRTDRMYGAPMERRGGAGRLEVKRPGRPSVGAGTCTASPRFDAKLTTTLLRSARRALESCLHRHGIDARWTRGSWKRPICATTAICEPADEETITGTSRHSVHPAAAGTAPSWASRWPSPGRRLA